MGRCDSGSVLDVYGARHIVMRKFGIPDRREIMRLRRRGFLYVCYDMTYVPIKAFKREPILLMDSDVDFRFWIHPKPTEKIEDVLQEYRDDEINYFIRTLKAGEMFDLNLMVAFDCIHRKEENKLRDELEIYEKYFLEGLTEHE